MLAIFGIGILIFLKIFSMVIKIVILKSLLLMTQANLSDNKLNKVENFSTVQHMKLDQTMPFDK